MSPQDPQPSEPPEDFDLEERASGIQRVLRGEPEPSPTEILEVAPMAIEAEAAVLGHAMRSAAAAEAFVERLTVDHFHSGVHRRIFEAVRTLVLGKKLALVPHVIDELRRTNRLLQVGEDYLAKTVRWAVEEVPIAASIEHLDDTLRRRKYLDACREMLARGYASPESTAELLDHGTTALVALAEGVARKAIPVLGGAALAEELPPIPWLVPGLKIAPGPPAMIGGYGYSRKTLAAQALLLSVAAGKPVWGLFGSRRGPVLHLDYEQGRRLSQDRYQRMARALGVDLAVLDIELAALPEMRLDAPGAEAIFTRACQGKALVLIDSFRAAAPTVDENSSEARGPLDMLTRVSERTGAAFLVIHHAKKPSKEEPGGDKFALRGSGGIFDACNEIFIFAGKKGEPTRVKHEKERIGGEELEDFGLASEDLPDPRSGRPKWGLRIVHLEAAQLESAPVSGNQQSRSEKFSEVLETVRKAIVMAPGCTKAHLAETLDVRKTSMLHACDELVRMGLIRVERVGTSHRLWPS